MPGQTDSFPKLKDYEIVEEIGKGGMGTVYKARHTRLDRMVALKIIRINYLASDDAEVVQRFEREARAAAQLRHPNIVLIYDFNQHEDIYYISMEYVQGQSLHQMIEAQGPLPVDIACDFIRQTALGLQHAFENGMVHRDIKPPNLLLQPAKVGGGVGEAAASINGTIKILDMGLVYFPGEVESSQLTMHGDVIGTPDYIAPEQTIDSHCVDIRSDLYSLGCTFYYLLAGKPPYGEFRLMQKLMMHQTKPPKPIMEIRPEVPVYVAQVLDRLLAKKPEDRFQTPWEASTALTPASNTPAPMPAAVPGSFPTNLPAPPPKSPQIIESQSISMFETMDRMPASGGSTIIKVSTPLPPTPLGEVAKAEPEGPPPPQQFAVLKRHGGMVGTVSFAPNRRTLASGSVDAALRLWDLGSSPDDKTIANAHPSDITRLAYSHDSEMLATASGSLEGMIRLWHCQATNAQALGHIKLGMCDVGALRFSPDGKHLALGANDKCVRIWDVHLANPKLLTTLKGHQSEITDIAFFPVGNLLASSSREGEIRIWDLTRFWSKDIGVIEGLWGQVACVAVSPQGNPLAFGSMDQKIHLWDLTSGQPRAQSVLEGHSGVPRIVQFNPDEETLLSVCDRGKCILWELASGKKRREWQLPSGHRTSWSVTFDGRYLATGNSDGTISLFRFYPRRDRS